MKLIGVAQEQHPGRTRLYLQWKQFDFTVFVDALNSLPHRVVPVPIGIDRNGIVRDPRLRRSEVDEFLNSSFPDKDIPDGYNTVHRTNVTTLRKKARESDQAATWRKLGDAYFVTDGDQHLRKSVDAYRRAVKKRPEHGPLHFRLGVALRRLHERGTPDSNAAQEAVRHWERALSMNPNQYIWRRRLQQYAPRLDKPYNFYFWIQKARREIRERGDEPVELTVEPRGSEIAPPQDETERTSVDEVPDPDPDGEVNRDRDPLVKVRTVATPVRVRPGSSVRVRVHFRLRPDQKPYWNNEAEPLTMSVDLPDGISLNEGQFRYPNDKKPETRGDRVLEFEVSVPEDTEKGSVEIPGYALYNVCEKKGGVCRFLRQDFSVSFQVDPHAPELKR